MSQNLHIRKTFNQMHSDTQLLINENVIYDPDREDKFLKSTLQELYEKHQCGPYERELLECQRSQELCLENAQMYAYCVEAHRKYGSQ